MGSKKNSANFRQRNFNSEIFCGVYSTISLCISVTPLRVTESIYTPFASPERSSATGPPEVVTVDCCTTRPLTSVTTNSTSDSSSATGRLIQKIPADGFGNTSADAWFGFAILQLCEFETTTWSV